jgi:DNA-directed RNA polymerase specialized sigma24 family protein
MDTILRVAAKCRDVDVSNYADRIGYFYAVARNVVHESHRNAAREATQRDWLKQELTRSPVPNAEAWEHQEAVHRCLERCMAKLPQRARRLIARYHEEKGAAKIAHHRILADELGKSVNALRIEVHRIRRTLQHCVFGCLSSQGNREVTKGRRAG